MSYSCIENYNTPVPCDSEIYTGTLNIFLIDRVWDSIDYLPWEEALDLLGEFIL